MNTTRIEGRCVWLREAILPGEIDAPKLQGEHKADVCIVGLAGSVDAAAHHGDRNVLFQGILGDALDVLG